MMKQSIRFWMSCGIALCSCSAISPTQALPIPDATLPNNSVVTNGWWGCSAYGWNNQYFYPNTVELSSYLTWYHARHLLLRSKNEPYDKSKWPWSQEYKQSNKKARLTSAFCILVCPRDTPYVKNNYYDAQKSKKGYSSAVHTVI